MTKPTHNVSDGKKPQEERPEMESEAMKPALADEQESANDSATAKELAAEVEHLKDQMLRAMAEAENTRRRLNKELDETRKYAVSNFAKEMLAVADNFRRALEAIPKDNGNNDTLKQLVAGVEATERQLLAGFEKFGIKKINPMGQPFDPHFHRVMMEVEDTAHPQGTIVQVLQEGYVVHDRLLREALVAVSKGGPVAHKVDTEA